jgi:hypothetical protein
MYDEYDAYLDELLEEAYLEGYYDSMDDMDDYYSEEAYFIHNPTNRAEFRKLCAKYEKQLRAQKAKLMAKRNKNPEKIDPIIDDIDKDLALLHEADYSSGETHLIIQAIKDRMKTRSKIISEVLSAVVPLAVSAAIPPLYRHITHKRKHKK